MKPAHPLIAFLAPMLAAACLHAQAQTPARDVRHVIVHTPGPAWVAGKTAFEQPGIQDHVAHYRQLQQQGKLALGGPFVDGAGGGMMIGEPGVSESELTAFAQADPAVKSGLLRAEVRPWLIGMRK